MSEDQRIFLGLGSNMGDRYRNIKIGINFLNQHPHIWILNKSYIYQSPSMYLSDQNDFYNMVIEIDSNLTPLDLLSEIKKIEIKVGRNPEEIRNISRILDIDILAVGSMEITSSILKIPHPAIFERKFVLKPWTDIAPEFLLPDSSLTVAELLNKTNDSSDVRMILILDKEDIL